MGGRLGGTGTVISSCPFKYEWKSGPTLFYRVVEVDLPQSLPVHPLGLKVDLIGHY